MRFPLPKKLALGLGVAACVFASQTSSAQFNPFSNILGDYTSTVILDANGGAMNTSAWSILGGGVNHLSLTTTVYDGIEQYALIQSGLSLSVGSEIKVTFSVSGNQDLGLYVGGTTPVTGTRQDYVAVYARGTGAVYSRGFDGTSEYPLAGGAIVAYDSLFIARTAANTYELGYYIGASRSIVTTRTPTTPNDGDVVGFYADVRGAGDLGFAAVPEPHQYALTLVGLMGVGIYFGFRRRKQRA